MKTDYNREYNIISNTYINTDHIIKVEVKYYKRFFFKVFNSLFNNVFFEAENFRLYFIFKPSIERSLYAARIKITLINNEVFYYFFYRDRTDEENKLYEMINLFCSKLKK